MLKPATPEALRLLMRGSEAFARIERNGLRIDVAYLDNAIKTVQAQIIDLEKRLQSAKEYKVWARHYGNKMNLESRPQLGRVIFDLLGHKRNPFLGKSNDVAAFEHLSLPFVKDYQNVKRLTKALSTNLKGIRRETVDGFLHPFQNLHAVESYRSSSNKPNLHNQPVRNKDISRIIRSCIIPRKGCVGLEADYGTQEVRVSYCYNQDPKLKHDILYGDMHTDFALKLFMLTPEELGPVGGKTTGKAIRQAAKNKFVFAEFYGDYYGHCAPNLFDYISVEDLRRSDGVSLFDHLKSKGIKRLGKCNPELEPKPGTFENHVKEVERWMWEDRYFAYNQWRKDWWAKYQRDGGVQTLTGFCQEGVFRRNQILCDPIQGSAFHCLLWSLTELELVEKIKKKLGVYTINQIHDAGMFDVPEKRVGDFCALFKEVAVERVAKEWPWITIPLSVEFESYADNWYEKSPLHLEVAA